MRPLTIVLAEAGLELVPREIENHPVVAKNAQKKGKKPSETLLDISLHYSAMKKLSKWYKRGRPDIVHISLLNALSSPLNIAGLLRVYVHTIDDRIINIDPGTRLPRNYNRFIGLIEQLLVLGRAPPSSEKPLLWIEMETLKDFVDMMNFDRIILMNEHGVKKTVKILGEELAKLMSNDKSVCVIIGAFQHGDFEETTLSLVHERISIFDKPLDSWIVVSRVIEGVENALRLC
ncbi:MAG: 16S rRNA methyltransferase [Ignisphaera sp.]|uniref:Ribosomal RNA small subunit methyltransferase Nep1 n=1 Tax=Ignisphaera aggregans TaxID=334771 RepID=A0A7C4NSN3_9CREN